jgi:hypothetical protein
MTEEVEALSFYEDASKSLFFFTGIVGAEMKKCTYNIKITVSKDGGDIENGHCECPTGAGPTASCKHIVSVLLSLSKFASTRELEITGSCTDQLQSFKRPRKFHSGLPVQAEALGPGINTFSNLWDG